MCVTLVRYTILGKRATSFVEPEVIMMLVNNLTLIQMKNFHKLLKTKNEYFFSPTNLHVYV